MLDDRTAIGGNHPPDPIDEAIAPFGDAISEAEHWLDGNEVTTEDQMRAVDAILKDIKAAEKAVKGAEESEAKPLYDAWKHAKERFKPTIDDLNRIKKGLADLVNIFKKKLAAEKAEAERKAREEADRKAREARKATEEAATSDIEAQREAAKKAAEADTARKAATAAGKDTVKGLRTVTRYEITDHRALLHHIARTDRDAVAGFIEEWARRNHKAAGTVDGMRVWQDKEAF